MTENGLAQFIEHVTGESHLRVEEDLGDGFVRLRTSEAERRQAQQDIRSIEDAVLELLRNSRDAGARIIWLATNREADRRTVVVIDDGEGVPPSMWERVFEPRVTSKLDTFHADEWGVHGRGMALFSIACNTVEHAVKQSGVGMGTAMRIRSDTKALPEKTDQSSLPRLVEDEVGRHVFRGPRNINRIVAEFTIAQRGSCLVYLGSPNEILATMVQSGNRALSSVERIFASDYDAYPVYLRPALAGTPEELAEVAHALGLDISTRSARRILDGQIAPLESFATVLSEAQVDGKHEGEKRRKAKASSLRLTAEERAEFAASVKRDFARIAEAYYLEPEVEPEIRVTKAGLSVTVPLVERAE